MRSWFVAASLVFALAPAAMSGTASAKIEAADGCVTGEVEDSSDMYIITTTRR